MARGLYRDAQGFAEVDYGTTVRMSVPRDRYEQAKHVPPFDELPWKDEFEAMERERGEP